MPKHNAKSSIQVEPSSQLYGAHTVEALRKILKSDSDIYGKTPYYVHSGHYGLDYIMSGKIDGSGGYPGGQVVEIFGPKSTGKTLLLLYAVKHMQQMGGVAIAADVERRWKRDFAELHGVDWNSLVIWSPATVEDFTVELINALEALPDNGKALICLDSLASLSTYWEIDNQGIKEDQGKKAKRIKATMRVLPGILAKKGAILLVANHIIEKPGVMFGPSYTTAGGQGVAFQATVRLELKTASHIKLPDKLVPIGIEMRAYCDKNSETIPFRQVNICVYWSKGIDPYSGLLELAEDHGIITHSGSWYVWNGQKFHGNEAMLQAIRNDPGFLRDPKWTSEAYYLVNKSIEND